MLRRNSRKGGQSSKVKGVCPENRRSREEKSVMRLLSSSLFRATLSYFLLIGEVRESCNRHFLFSLIVGKPLLQITIPDDRKKNSRQNLLLQFNLFDLELKVAQENEITWRNKVDWSEYCTHC